MKIKTFTVIVLILLTILLIFSLTSFKKQKEVNVLLLPSLPRPIAKEYALITSAGQSTDAYIINDVANKLLIHSYFMPEAKISDLEGIKTIVFVVGYSSLGEKFHGASYAEEKTRIKSLLNRAKAEKLTVVEIIIGGNGRRGKNNDELLRLICPFANYLIGTKDADWDHYLSELARDNKIPLTLINEVNDISEPFASIFR